MKQKEDKKDQKGAKEHKQPWQQKYASPDEVRIMREARLGGAGGVGEAVL